MSDPKLSEAITNIPARRRLQAEAEHYARLAEAKREAERKAKRADFWFVVGILAAVAVIIAGLFWLQVWTW